MQGKKTPYKNQEPVSRKTAIKELLAEARGCRAAEIGEYKRHLGQKVKEVLNAGLAGAGARSVARVCFNVLQKDHSALEGAKRDFVDTLRGFEKNRRVALEKISGHGAGFFEENSVVLTHCCSDSVIGALKKAGKNIGMVFVPEARPLLQGRVAAGELLKAKIPCTMVLDCFAPKIVEKANVFATGADAVLGDGSLVNRVGTFSISLAAQRFGVPHYVFCSTQKLEPASFFGLEEAIEERGSGEVWSGKPKKLVIRNPALDITPAPMVKAYVTEQGVFSPKEIAKKIDSEFEPGGGKGFYGLLK